MTPSNCTSNTGEKRKTMRVNFDPEQGPSFGEQDIETLQKVFGSMTPEDEMELREQYGDDWDQPGDDDEHDL